MEEKHKSLADEAVEIGIWVAIMAYIYSITPDKYKEKLVLCAMLVAEILCFAALFGCGGVSTIHEPLETVLNRA